MCQFIFLPGLCLGREWPGRAWFNTEIKQILSGSKGGKKATLLAWWPIQKSSFFFHNKTKEVIFILKETAQNTWKVLFPKISLQGRYTLRPNDNWGLVQSSCFRGGWGILVLNYKWTSYVLLLHSDQRDRSLHHSQQLVLLPIITIR